MTFSKVFTVFSSPSPDSLIYSGFLFLTLFNCYCSIIPLYYYSMHNKNRVHIYSEILFICKLKWNQLVNSWICKYSVWYNSDRQSQTLHFSLTCSFLIWIFKSMCLNWSIHKRQETTKDLGSVKRGRWNMMIGYCCSYSLIRRGDY